MQKPRMGKSRVGTFGGRSTGAQLEPPLSISSVRFCYKDTGGVGELIAIAARGEPWRMHGGVNTRESRGHGDDRFCGSFDVGTGLPHAADDHWIQAA